jgi:hypothetical protein
VVVAEMVALVLASPTIGTPTLLIAGLFDVVRF